MRFAHLADCHLGGWRDPKLTDANGQAFEKAIDKCMDLKVDFVIISGDLFHTSLPPIDKLSLATKKFRELKDSNIPTYIIEGGHDFSPSGKTMLRVLQEADLVTNVSRGSVTDDGKLRLEFTTDPRTGVKITGIVGRKGMLDKRYYEELDRAHLEREPGRKIFMFHTALSELKPEGTEEMLSAPLSFLPKGFDYYAGGHVHIVLKKELPDYGVITYPGPTFPNNFKELEELRHGGFYLVDEWSAEWQPVTIAETYPLRIEAENKTPREVTEEVIGKLSDRELHNTIVLLRFKGKLIQGRPSDIDFQAIDETAHERGAFFVMRNTLKLTSEEFEAFQRKHKDSHDIEQDVIRDHVSQIELFDKEKAEGKVRGLMQTLSMEKDEGERNIDYENRLVEALDDVLDNN